MTIRLVFITRVKKFDPINDHMIDVNKDLTNTISKPDEKNPRPREKVKIRMSTSIRKTTIKNKR